MMSLVHSAKIRLARALCHPAVGQAVGAAFGAAIPSRGLRIDTHAPGVGPSTAALLFWGLYEAAEIRFVRQHLATDLDVIELGASIGVVTSHIARTMTGSGRLVAVEANPNLLQLIERNVEVNARKRPHVLHCAVDYGGAPSVTFSVASEHIASGIGRVGCQVDVPARTLSSIVSEVGFERFALVSDIEGAEAGIILEDGAALKRCEQAIFELHDTEHRGRRYTAAELRAVLVREHGFSLIAERGPVCVLAR